MTDYDDLPKTVRVPRIYLAEEVTRFPIPDDELAKPVSVAERFHELPVKGRTEAGNLVVEWPDGTLEVLR